MGPRGSGDDRGQAPVVGPPVQLIRRTAIASRDDPARPIRPIWEEDRRPDAPEAAGTAGLPTEFPVFPLAQAMLLPRMRLPLNIFEPRYLNMVEAALARGRMFGMIQPRSRKEGAAGRSEAPPVANLQRVGCLGRLSSFNETDDGCFVVSLTGLARFDVVDELPLRQGFRSVRASFDRWAADLGPLAEPDIDRTALLDLLRRYFRTRGLDANWDAVEQIPNAALIDTLCLACPFGDTEKQALLESRDAASRARDLQALLAMGLHENDDKDRTRHVS